MYGLLLEGIFFYVKLKYGEEIWEQILKESDVAITSFNTHKVYNEAFIPKIALATSDLTGFTVEEVLEDLGIIFVTFIGQYGYDGVLKVLGRHLRDFLNGLDNLHEYLRFSYPKLKPPSFFCVNESRTGLTLHYRSRRHGFIHYVKGQIKEVARQFYHTECEIEIVSEFFQEGMVNVIVRLHFDNRAYRNPNAYKDANQVEALPVPSEVFFEVFPFNLVFNRGLKIRNIGDGLKAVMPQIVGVGVADIFYLTRPLVNFTWESVMMHTNNVFEIVTVVPVSEIDEHIKHLAPDEGSMLNSLRHMANKNKEQAAEQAAQAKLERKKTSKSLVKRRSSKSVRKTSKAESEDGEKKDEDGEKEEKKEEKKKKSHKEDEPGSTADTASDEDDADDAEEQRKQREEELLLSRCLKLKGQMMYMNDWDSIIFLGTPVMSDINSMFNAGLFINDLSMHDSSRDLILAGSQQSAELKLLLDQEQQKAKKLEASMRKLDIEMKKTDQLLYQMIPRAVADRLRKGEAAVSTCETFESVTILFSDVVGFTTICSRISPLEVVTMLNSMYTKFDQLSEDHKVYKVETIADSYMIVSGAPIRVEHHACFIADMALGMCEAIRGVYGGGEQLPLRCGAHSGTVVAGVVGLKMPRYCLFGDTVNTSSRMESNSEAQKIHISETTKAKLEGYPYQVKERGTVQVKGKGVMKTYWLEGKSEFDMNDPKIKAMVEEKQNMETNAASSQTNLGSLFDVKSETGTTKRDMFFDPSKANEMTALDIKGGRKAKPVIANGRIMTTKAK